MRRRGTPERIGHWARSQTTHAGDEWVLMPMGIGDHGPAAIWPVDAAADPDWGAVVMQTAQGDADARECDTRYELRLARDGRCVVSHAIRCRVSEDGPGHEMGLDGSASSVIAQMQRHNEAMVRQMLACVSGTLGPMQEILKAQHARILELEGERIKLTDQVAAIPATTEGTGIPAEWMELAKAALPVVLEAALRSEAPAAAAAAHVADAGAEAMADAAAAVVA